VGLENLGISRRIPRLLQGLFKAAELKPVQLLAGHRLDVSFPKHKELLLKNSSKPLGTAYFLTWTYRGVKRKNGSKSRWLLRRCSFSAGPGGRGRQLAKNKCQNKLVAKINFYVENIFM
jgi:hypothetical protein